MQPDDNTNNYYSDVFNNEIKDVINDIDNLKIIKLNYNNIQCDLEKNYRIKIMN